jgi:uncharacterized membrane protein YdjX (TVP38/TMEM64 family)
MPAAIETTLSLRSFNRGKLLVVLLLALAVGLFLYLDLGHYLSLDALKANRDRLLSFTEEHYAASVAIFIPAYCLLVAASLPGAVFMTLAGGFLFGPLLATLYINLGATAGATLAFLSARYLLHDWVERRFGARLGPLQEGIAKNGFSYLLTLRLIPIMPFFVINALSGLTRIPLATYVAATAIGIIPGTFVYAYAGRQLGAINSLREIASPRVLLAFTLLGALALVPGLYRKYQGRREAA